MASVVRLATGTLISITRQAANVCSAPLRLLHAPRLPSSAHPLPQQGTAATGVSSLRHASTMTRSILSSSSTLSSPLAAPSLLRNVQKFAPLINVQGCRGYHVRVALKKRCSSCFFVRRKGRLYVECKAKPRHKQMQVMTKRKTWKEDYSEGNIHKAIYWNYDRDYTYYKLGDTPFARHDWLKGKIGVTV